MSDATDTGPFEHLTQQAYHVLVHSLTTLLPPLPGATPDAVQARNQAAIAKVAAMLPVNADETDLAVQCVLARARAEEALREIPRYPRDTARVDLLTRQFALMERTALGLRNQLLRLQAVRHKREALPAACEADGWTAHIAASTLQATLVAAEPMVPEPVAAPEPLPPEPPLPEPPPPEPAAAEPAAPPDLVPPGEPKRDLAAEAERYAALYPQRARRLRQSRGLPKDCDFGPPDRDLLRAIVTGVTPRLRLLDTPAARAG